MEREDSKTGEVSGEGSDAADSVDNGSDGEDGTEWKTDVSESAQLRRQKELSAAAAALVQGTEAVRFCLSSLGLYTTGIEYFYR
jgi:hypothetical protein